MQLYKPGQTRGLSVKLTVMMKLSVLLLLALPALSSATLLNIVNSTEQKNVSLLDPDLGERIPEINANDSMLLDKALLTPPVELRGRHGQHQPFHFGGTTLEWQTWRGFIPHGAVFIYNHYTRRYDFVCKYRCEAGFYNPRMGPYCHYPFARRAYRCSPFEILVNRDNFALLEWRPGRFGSVPQNSVETCPGGGKYVGKNRYGLGKVHPKHRAFFLPWKKKEYWYRRRYEVLTINKAVRSEQIFDVKYNTDSLNIFKYPPETMRISGIANHACREVTKEVTLSKTYQVEHRWDTSLAITVGVTSTITTGIPSLISAEIGFSVEKTMELSSGKSVIEEDSHSVSVEVPVPPNHSCRVRLVGHKYKADIPFTARVKRIYYNGETRWTVITGTYYSVHVGEIWASVDRCTPIPNSHPCR